jgi:hypothetical protein
MVYFGKKPKMAKPTSSSPPTTNAESSQFSSELSPESVDFSTTMAAKSVATSVGTSATKVGAIVGVSTAVAATVLTTVIVTSLILSASKSNSSTYYLDYMENCSNSSYSLCKTYLGLACVNNLCLCNNSTTQYYNGSLCG